jgi:phosphoserine phosphatase RsbU/P
VSKHIPDYLKLHTEEVSAPPSVTEETLHALGELCAAFTAAVGWQVRPARRDEAPATPTTRLGIEFARADADRGGGSPRQDAQRLADSINRLLGEWHSAAHALWQREAELAAGVPVSPRPDEEQHLAERLEAILRGGAEAVGCAAAALYLLDEATSHLKLRAVWGMPRRKLMDPPRPLRGAVADLEALVGHAVVLEDTSLLPHWRVPEDYPAAVCLPVATPNTPLGTLWVFATERRDFSERETNVLEIVAGRIASELEREMLLVEGVASKEWQEQVARASQRQQHRLPTFAPLLDHWDLAAWTTCSQPLSSEFYDWGVLCDGRPYIAVGASEGTMLDAALSSTTQHAALKARSTHPHDARQMLEAINETMWGGSAGDQFASMWYGILDAEQGDCEYAFAGRQHAFIVGPRGMRPLTHAAALLGLGPDTRFPSQRTRLQADELLVLASSGVFRVRDEQGELIRDEQLADVLRRHLQSAESTSSAQQLVDHLRAFLLAFMHGTDLPECTLLVARRKCD